MEIRARSRTGLPSHARHFTISESSDSLSSASASASASSSTSSSSSASAPSPSPSHATSLLHTIIAELE